MLRGGFGTFYDIGAQTIVGAGVPEFPFNSRKSVSPVILPVTPAQLAPVPPNTSGPPVGDITVAIADLQLPRTYQWNVALEQTLGAAQTLSLTYIGAAGRDLLRKETLFQPNPNFSGFVSVWNNTATSDYHALQVQFQRKLSHGFQTLASYTFSHSVDIASTDNFATGTNSNLPGVIGRPSLDRGNSDFDVRHSASAALTYDLPVRSQARAIKALLSGWSLDSLVTARTALPVNLKAGSSFAHGVFFQPRPDRNLGQPLYLYGSQYPGGRAFNKAAFSTPLSGTQGNFGRNVLRAFPASQWDVSVQRQFHLSEAVGLRFRAEFFNILNHPNFGAPNNDITSPLFGQSSQTLASSLGTGGVNGGFNPLYQIGGPRSIQLALKLVF